MQESLSFLIRADASIDLGTGHVMRCLTLALELQKAHQKITFLCREEPGHLKEHLERSGFRVFMIPAKNSTNPDSFQGTDLRATELLLQDIGESFHGLIIDHYRLGIDWERNLRSRFQKIMVIDDLANRPHECDLLLDQNFCENFESRYRELIPTRCKTFLGPRYALLRPEFHEAGKAVRMRDGAIRQVLVFFGGSDPSNETEKALRAIQALDAADIIFHIVVGESNPRKEQIRAICQHLPNARFYCQIDYMAHLMCEADLAIGSPGSASWERCFLGLPAVVIITAENQEGIGNKLAKEGAVWNLGWGKNVSVEHLRELLADLVASPHKVKEASDKSGSIFPREGPSGVKQIVQALLGEI